MMDALRTFASSWSPEVLFAYEPAAPTNTWVQHVDDVLAPKGCRVVRAFSGREAIKRVELGRLSAAVLMADRDRIDALSLLRIIRSINVDLPCWLVMQEANRWTLETALSLHAMSVINHPVDEMELALALSRVLWKS